MHGMVEGEERESLLRWSVPSITAFAGGSPPRTEEER